MADPPTVVELFCGAGGLSAGFERAGFEAVAGVDVDPRRAATWDANHTGSGVVADVGASPEAVAATVAAADPDVLVGGPPCKDLSGANRRRDGDRTSLVAAFGRVVAAARPPAFVVENVPALLSGGVPAYNALREVVRGAGYTVRGRLLYAPDYGVAQRRVRAVVVGLRQFAEPMFPRPTHGPHAPPGAPPAPTAAAALGGADPSADPTGGRGRRGGGAADDPAAPPGPTGAATPDRAHARLLEGVPPGLNYTIYRLSRPSASGLDPEGEGRTLITQVIVSNGTVATWVKDLNPKQLPAVARKCDTSRHPATAGETGVVGRWWNRRPSRTHRAFGCQFQPTSFEGGRGELNSPAGAVQSQNGEAAGLVPAVLHTAHRGHPDPVYEWREEFSDLLYVAAPDRPARTVKARPGALTGPFHWAGRRFALSELLALQGFPPDYTLAAAPTEARRQVGNAVPPPLAAAVARAVAEQVGLAPPAEAPAGLVGAGADLDVHARRTVGAEEYRVRARRHFEADGDGPPAAVEAAAAYRRLTGGGAPDPPDPGAAEKC